MGLLDWNEPTENDLFPDFEAATPISNTFGNRPFRIGSGTSLSTTSSVGSSSSTSSQESNSDVYDIHSSPVEIRVTRPESPADASRTTDPSPPAPSRPRLNLHIPPEYNAMSNVAATPRMRSRPKFRRSAITPVMRLGKPYFRKRSQLQSFDLFGQDAELQEAESRIGFCDICLKHCNQHL